MTPFLKLVADDLYRKLDGDFQNTTIIFPNKRATLFFTNYLLENAGDKTIWTPEYTTISELFASLSDHIVGDPVYLITQLYDAYSKVTDTNKNLDELFSLMEMILADFEDIDNNMVNPKGLFQNIDELKELTDLNYLEEEQIEALQTFFNKFFIDTDESSTGTDIKTNFSTLWNRLTDIYELYRQTLTSTQTDSDTLVYEGMLKRQVIETLEGADEVQRSEMDSRLTSTTYVMVGFNVLNKTELKLFRYLKENRDTKFYWDYDAAYTKRNPHTEAGALLSRYEAGQFILENISKLADEFKGEDIFRNMAQPKSIKFIQSPTENAQTRYIDQWINDNIKEGDKLNESAIILCNENLLQPVLHSIPGSLKSTDKESVNSEILSENSASNNPSDNPFILNVTMGYPLTDTPVFSFIQALLELQIHGQTQTGAWRYKYVSAILKHSFVKRIVGEESYEKLRELTKNNVIFPEMDRFTSNEFLRTVFTKRTGRNLTEYISNILTQIGHTYSNTSNGIDFTLQLYKESIFVAYKVVNRIHTMQETNTSFAVSDETLSRLIMRFLRAASIPLHGEPANGLQVMGFLETRNLDFRNIIMLSTNEGQMPTATKRPSLIPYTLRVAFGMTTIEKEVSIYAYYYYRLLQRAESITLLYNSNTEDGGKGEMSRFMLQTLAETKKLFSTSQTIQLYSFTSLSELYPISNFKVTKTPDILRLLRNRFNTERNLSPSALNVYMACPLKFYFQYVAGLRSDDEVSEDVDNSMFGTIFHYAMEKIYEPYKGKKLNSATIRNIMNDTDLIFQKIDNGFAVELFKKPESTEIKGVKTAINYSQTGPNRITFNGTQLINRFVLSKFVHAQLNADQQIAEDAHDEFVIVETEKTHKTLIDVNTTDGNTFKVSIGGIVDRIDKVGNGADEAYRIVDYKTSATPHTTHTVEEIFDIENSKKTYHILQTLYYAYVLTSPGQVCENKTVLPALMYFINNKSKTMYPGVIKLESLTEFNDKGNPKYDPITDFADYRDDFHTHFQEKINELFSPGEFTQCETDDSCQYCDFRTFCGRKKKDRKY